MYRDKVFIVKEGPLYDYCKLMCIGAKNLKNVTNFYIRQVMTGIQKSPSERQPNEIQVLSDLEKSIPIINKIRENSYNTKVNKIKNNKSLSDLEKQIAIDELELKVISMPTPEKWYLDFYTMDALFKVLNQVDYRSISSHVSQSIMKEVNTNWISCFSSIRTYKKQKDNYTGKPNLPKYVKTNEITCTFTNGVCEIKANENNKSYLKFPKTNSKLWLGNYLSPADKLKEVKIKPVHGIYEIHIIIEEPDTIEIPKTSKNIIAIDPGVNNFAAISNNIGLPPVVIKGKVLKAKNQWFNKKIAYYRSILTKGTNSKIPNSKRIQSLYRKRRLFFKDYFHKISKSIIEYCINNNIDTIVVGNNKLQKQDNNFKKKDKQNFLYIPYDIFFNNLKYLCKYNGIIYIDREESYTSQSSFLDMDFIPTYKENNKEDHKFSGKRIHRGLYKSKEGILFNADVNGASNILRKQFPTAFDNIDLSYIYKVVVIWNVDKWYNKKQMTNLIKCGNIK